MGIILPSEKYVKASLDVMDVNKTMVHAHVCVLDGYCKQNMCTTFR